MPIIDTFIFTATFESFAVCTLYKYSYNIYTVHIYIGLRNACASLLDPCTCDTRNNTIPTVYYFIGLENYRVSASCIRDIYNILFVTYNPVGGNERIGFPPQYPQCMIVLGTVSSSMCSKSQYKVSIYRIGYLHCSVSNFVFENRLDGLSLNGVLYVY